MKGAPFLRQASDVIARQDDKFISQAVFLAQIQELAERLPARGHVVNFCADRYRFTVAWAAAMMRGQVTLLPSNRHSASVAALHADYPTLYVLTDTEEADDLPASRFAYPMHLGTTGASRVPVFPADQVAAVLFTSGSTGHPNPSPRRWGRLVASALATGAALGIDRFAGVALVATVPHAHSYGLESAIMLPLQHGLLLTANRPFFAADVAAALACDPFGVLVTTPVHLRALVEDAAAANPGPGFGAPVRAGFVLSATAPLSGELAARAEATFNAPVYEIFGCSEAGQLATRRTVEGQVWRCLDGFRLRHDPAGGTWASGPDEDDVLLSDSFELIDNGAFILQGRTADMVNIAGKRSSLAYLTSELTAIDGVRDGVFLLPETSDTGARARLTAVAVAPGLDAAQILAALRTRIDPAFLPRPLHVVASLPRNSLGKLPRNELLDLIKLSPVSSPDPPPVLLSFPADHPAAPGHFPGNPIVPGAVLLDVLVTALHAGGWSGQIEAAKFHHPVRPGDSVAVTHASEGDKTRFTGRLAGSDQIVLSGILRSIFP